MKTIPTEFQAQMKIIMIFLMYQTKFHTRYANIRSLLHGNHGFQNGFNSK